MIISSVRVLAVAALFTMTAAGAAEAADHNRCHSKAGIAALAAENGFSQQYTAMSCNAYSGTNWDVAEFPG